MENLSNHKHHRSIFWPLVFILGGLILLLSNLNLLGSLGWNILWSLWPLLFIIGGIDSIYRKNHFVGPLVFIGLGSIILLNNLGYLTFSWQTLIGFWPVLLIALGLDIIIGRRSAWGAVLGVTLGIMLIASVLWLVLSMPWIGQTNRYQNISQPLNGLTRASIELDPTFGSVQVNSGSSAANLLDGRLRQFSEGSVSASPLTIQNGHGYFSMENHGFYLYPVSAAASSNMDWDVKLTSAVPVDLDSEMVMGDHQLILNLTRVENLKAETVLGRMIVSLPQQGFKQGRINMVMGQTVVYVPRGVKVNIKTDTVLVPVTYPAGFERKGDQISNIQAADGQAIELEIGNVIGTVSIEYEP